MKRIFSLLTLMLLVACTGTTESGTPIFLVVGYEAEVDGDMEGRIGLVEDDFAVSGASQDRLSFVEGSSRTLPAAPVAYDLTDRNNVRGRLVVLSRNDGPEGSTAFLSFFNVRNVSADSPAGFERTRPDDLELSETGLDTSNPDLPLNLEFCPVDVQVSEGGRYAALLHDGAPCGLPRFEALDVIDLNAPTPRVLERFGVQVEPAGIYLLQERANVMGNRLYFLRDDPVGVQVTEVTLPSENDNSPEIDTVGPDSDVREVEDVPTDNQDAVDLGLVRSLDEDGNITDPVLVTLFEESFVPIRNFTNTGENAENAPTRGERVDTIEESEKLITDDFLLTDAVFVLGEDEFTVHGDVTADAEEAADITAADAVYEPNNDFVFFVSDERISIFDSRSFLFEEDDDIDIVPFSIPELTNPAFITWIQAVGDAPLPQSVE